MEWVCVGGCFGTPQRAMIFRWLSRALARTEATVTDYSATVFYWWLSRALARTEATVVGYDHTGCFDTPLRAMIFRWLSRALACIEATVVGYDHTGCFDTPYRATQQPTLFGG